MALQYKIFSGRSSRGPVQKKAEKQRNHWQSAASDAEYWMNSEPVEVIDVKCHASQGKSRVTIVVMYRDLEISPGSDGRYSLHLVVTGTGENKETWQRTVDQTVEDLAAIADKQFLSQGVPPNGDLISCSFSQVSHKKQDAASSVRLICTGGPRRRRGYGYVKFNIVAVQNNHWNQCLLGAQSVVQNIVDEGGTVVDLDMLAVEPRNYTSPSSMVVIAYTQAQTPSARRPTTPVTLEFVENSTGSKPQALSKRYAPTPTLWEMELSLLAKAAGPLAQANRLICIAFAPWQCEKGGPAWMLIASYDTMPLPEQFAIEEPRATSPVGTRRFTSPRGTGSPRVQKLKRGEGLIVRGTMTPGDFARSWSPNPRARSPGIRRGGASPSPHTEFSTRTASSFNRTATRRAVSAPSRRERPVGTVGSTMPRDPNDTFTMVAQSRLQMHLQATEQIRPQLEPEPEPEFMYAATSPGMLTGPELGGVYREHLRHTGTSAMDVAPQQLRALDESLGARHTSSAAPTRSRIGKSRGFKPVHYAAYEGNVDMLLECVENGAAIDRGDKQKNTPLHVACERGHIEFVDALIAIGALDLNSRNAQRQTPLHVAAAHGHLELIKRLLDSGLAAEMGRAVPDVSLRDIADHTAAEIAEDNHYHKLAEFLTLRGGGAWRGLNQDSDDDERGSVRADEEAVGARLTRQYVDLPPGSVDSKYSPPPPSPLPRAPKRTRSEGLTAAHDVLMAHKNRQAAELPRATVEASAGYAQGGEVSTRPQQKREETNTEQIMRLAQGLDERELSVVVAALSKEYEEMKAARKRVKSGTQKRRDANLYQTSLQELSVEELRHHAEGYGFDSRQILLKTSTSRSADVKTALVELMMSRYKEIVDRGGHPPRPIMSAADTNEPSRTPYLRSSREGSTKPMQAQAVGGAVTGQGRPDSALQFVEQSLAPTVRDSVATPDQQHRHQQMPLPAGQRIDPGISDNFKFDVLVKGGSWYLCELQPETPEYVAARLPETFGHAFFWNVKTQLYYDSQTPPDEVAVEVRTKVLGHESLQASEQVLNMLDSTGFPIVHMETHRELERYVNSLRGAATDKTLRPNDSSQHEHQVSPSSTRNGRTRRSPTPEPRGRSPSPPSPLPSRSLEATPRGAVSGVPEPARGESTRSINSHRDPPAEGSPPQREAHQKESHKHTSGVKHRYGGTRLEQQMEIMRAERKAAKEAKRATKRLANQQPAAQ